MVPGGEVTLASGPEKGGGGGRSSLNDEQKATRGLNPRCTLRKREKIKTQEKKITGSCSCAEDAKKG